MSAVATSALPLRMPSITTVGSRPRDNMNSPNDNAWERALVSAAHESASGAASVETASRLFDLNAVMASPAAELVLSPSGPAPAASMALPDRDFTVSPEAVEAQTTLTTPRAARATGHADARESEATSASHPAELDAAVAAPTVGRAAVSTKPGERAVKGASTSRDAAVDEGRPVVRPAGTLFARPEGALAAYAQAISSNPIASEVATSFTLTSTASLAPVRVHVQWRNRTADVWIGLHRRAFDQLPDIRAGIQDWVSSRGGVVGRVVCNGERLEGVPSSSCFPGVL